METIKTIPYQVLVGPIHQIKSIPYEIIETIKPKKTLPVIIVRNLHPDFFLYFSYVSLIITEAGSKLSHLAILAHDFQKQIIICPDIISQIPNKTGLVSISQTEVLVSCL